MEKIRALRRTKRVPDYVALACYFFWYINYRCAGRVEVKVARAGDRIEEAPAANSSAAADGAGDAGRANVNGTSAEGTADVAASEVTAILYNIRECGSKSAQQAVVIIECVGGASKRRVQDRRGTCRVSLRVERSGIAVE